MTLSLSVDGFRVSIKSEISEISDTYDLMSI